ncbi:hypothetical protein MRX96_047432 [Rhipicephalus microplus]
MCHKARPERTAHGLNNCKRREAGVSRRRASPGLTLLNDPASKQRRAEDVRPGRSKMTCQTERPLWDAAYTGSRASIVPDHPEKWSIVLGLSRRAASLPRRAAAKVPVHSTACLCDTAILVRSQWTAVLPKCRHDERTRTHTRAKRRFVCTIHVRWEVLKRACREALATQNHTIARTGTVHSPYGKLNVGVVIGTKPWAREKSEPAQL